MPSSISRNADRIRAVFIAVTLLASAPSQADTVAVSASLYTDEVGSLAGDAGIVVPAGPVDLRATVGYSRVDRDDASPLLPTDDIGFAYGGVGVDWFVGSLTASLDASLWGDEALAETRDYRASLRYDWPRVAVFATGVFRRVEAEVPRLEPGGIVRESRSLDVPGYGGGIEVQVATQLRLYIAGEDQQYDRKFPRLGTLRTGGIGGQRLLTYSSIVPDWWWSAGADLLLGDHRLNVEYLADRSIFGALDTRTVSAAWRLPLGRAGRQFVDLRVGSSNPDNGAAQVFGLLGWTGLF